MPTGNIWPDISETQYTPCGKDEFPECTYLPILGKTYHAGEDFLDVVDGLRAIDEAIRFLNLDCGDRIGHALALGVNVAEWYQGKGCQISLSTQDHLDNIAWMYHALKRYKIEGCEVLKDYLQEQFRYYFSKCYLSFMDSAQLYNIMENATAAYRDLSGKVNIECITAILISTSTIKRGR